MDSRPAAARAGAGEMKCPRCRVDLERKTVRGRATEVDRCPKCAGVWFDDGEIGQVIGSPGAPRLTVPPNARPAAGQRCPRCAETLFVFAYPGTMTVVEACRSCSGVWLDAGELDDIHRASAGRRMECPRCGHEQPRAESCVQCGIVISKASEPPRRRAEAPAQRAPRQGQAMHDEIPGVKGTLIRFIDRSLETIVSGIKGR